VLPETPIQFLSLFKNKECWRPTDVISALERFHEFLIKDTWRQASVPCVATVYQGLSLGKKITVSWHTQEKDGLVIL
jgi:hypothetical protein